MSEVMKGSGQDEDAVASGAVTSDSYDPYQWNAVAKSFYRFHRSPLNNAIHCITTPLCIFGVFALIHDLLIRFSSDTIAGGVVVALALAWLVSIAVSVPKGLTALSALLLASAAAGAILFDCPWWLGAIVFTAAYVLQDIGHWFACEQTYQSSYQGDAKISAFEKWKTFALHTLWLPPLVFVASLRRSASPLRLIAARSRVIDVHLNDPQSVADMATIRGFFDTGEPVLTSQHWWQNELTDDVRGAFDRLSESTAIKKAIRDRHDPGSTVESVLGMNELYITGPPKKLSSDTVFYTSHADGPWAFWPGCTVYRVMLAASQNPLVTTLFPMDGPDYHEPVGFRLENGDAAAFDFNRELHYITRKSPDGPIPPRINLKLHFVAYPKRSGIYGRTLANWTTAYDRRARELFLNTINPESLYGRLRATFILWSTHGFRFLIRRLGPSNLFYVLIGAILSAAVGSLVMFAAWVSFVHYAVYLANWFEPGRVAMTRFVRDGVFFKTISLSTLAVITLTQLDANGWNWLASPLGIFASLLFLGGISLSTLSASRLGWVRTYFGEQLGYCQPKWIDQFPYGVLPHPMLIGSASFLIALGFVPGMWENYPWLIPGHLLGYAAVTAAEKWDWRKKRIEQPSYERFLQDKEVNRDLEQQLLENDAMPEGRSQAHSDDGEEVLVSATAQMDGTQLDGNHLDKSHNKETISTP